MVTDDINAMAYRSAMPFLENRPNLGREEILATVNGMMGFLAMQGAGNIDVEALVRKLEADLNVWVGAPTTLSNPWGHEEWLAAARSQISWRYWERYRKYLIDIKAFPPDTTRKLDEVTDDILKYLENPLRDGRWDRRGMVVGQVQSGKTANYTGLICKAADAGYKLIVVLAGSHNSLRSQTQLRLDEGFLGYDTQKARSVDQSNRLIGAGAMPGAAMLTTQSVTSSHENGDFSLKVANTVSNVFGGDPFLLVIKKNQSVLKNVIKWATSIQQTIDPETAESIVENIPLLVIDDEADSASINTKAIPLDEHGKPDPDYDPSKINGQIRLLLKCFGQSAYVGYTATPFANIFIPSSEDQQTSKYGDDLFPRSFIINLPAPSNYMGPVQVFGLSNTDSDSLDTHAGLPIVRLLEDYESWIPDKHRASFRPDRKLMPASMKVAIRSFLLTCATRSARGQSTDHNSMLVHVTRFTDVQDQVAAQVKDELATLKNRLRYGDGNSNVTLLDELRQLWENDYVPTSQQIQEDTAPVTTWAEVKQCLQDSTEKIEVLVINGKASDALSYYEHRKAGLNCIAIGGDKLSRGLTLEGLSVSYYLRASKMYDTLMQMGRWFGYRPEYGDLCRLYTTDELAGWYADITLASEELRREFDIMASERATPSDYGLRVRSHPDGLLVTAAAKMRDAETVQISFSGTISETVRFDLDPAIVTNNYQATQSLLLSLGGDRLVSNADKEGNIKLWATNDPTEILRFLTTYKTHESARKARADVLAKYIELRNRNLELTHWTVILAGGKISRFWPGNTPVRLAERKNLSDRIGEYRIGRLVSPADESRDLSPVLLKKALENTRELPDREKADTASGVLIRRLRPATDGLLML